MQKEDFRLAVECNLKFEILKKAAFLKEFRVFKKLSFQKLRKIILTMAPQRHFNRGQIVFK